MKACQSKNKVRKTLCCTVLGVKLRYKQGGRVKFDIAQCILCLRHHYANMKDLEPLALCEVPLPTEQC